MRLDTAKSHKSTIIIIVVSLIVVIAVTAIIIRLSSGQTVTSGTYPAPVSTDSLSCTSTSRQYPYLSNQSNNSTTKINIVLGKSAIESISLTTTLQFDSPDTATNARNFNQAAMNEAFSKKSFAVDELTPVYSTNGSTFTMNLYASAKNLNRSTAEFFLLDPDTIKSFDTNTLNSFYRKLGFNCKVNQ